MTSVFSILWVIKSVRVALFWLYLMQLKEYRFDRLFDHFNTSKGKKLLIKRNALNVLSLFASIFLISTLAQPGPMTLSLISTILLLYIAESIAATKSLFRKHSLPVFTKKSLVPTLGSLLFVLGFLWYALSFSGDTNFFVSALLLGDILVPPAVLLVVSALKPLNFLLKQRVFAKAKRKRESLRNLHVIGTTGSFGKTTTKEIIGSVLEKKFRIIKTPEHVNTEIGIANFFLKNVNSNHDVFICEMGAYKKGEIKTIAKFLKPNMGVFIGANEQHLALFGTMENLVEGEGGGELLALLPRDGVAIFNGENIYARKMHQRANIKKILCGEDIKATDIDVLKDKTTFKTEGTKFETKLLAKAIAKIKPFPQTFELKKSKQGRNVIDATYSSNPSGVLAHLDYLASWKKYKKIVVMPCLIELGDASKRVHKEIGQRLAETTDLAIITTKDCFGDIASGAKLAKKNGEVVNLFDEEKIISKIKSFAVKESVILLEGRISKLLAKKIYEET